jgi:hypothetical protein
MDARAYASGDIVSHAHPESFLVCGFFTPDYRALTERLVRDLAPSIPYHFFFREKGTATWREIVRWKPDVILQAMELYPGKQIILLDVDCSVMGPIKPMTDFSGDVSGYPVHVFKPRPWPMRGRFKMHISSRSLALKPTDRTKTFLTTWREECRDKVGKYRRSGCEMAMLTALTKTTGIAFCPMDIRYSGRESKSRLPDAVITHTSASQGQEKPV